MSGQPLLSDGKENDGYMRMSAEVFAAADESFSERLEKEGKRKGKGEGKKRKKREKKRKKKKEKEKKEEKGQRVRLVTKSNARCDTCSKRSRG